MHSYAVLAGAFAATAFAGPLAVADEPVLVARAPASSAGGTVVSATQVSATSTSVGPTTSNSQASRIATTTRKSTTKKTTTKKRTTTKKKTTKRKTTTKKKAKSKQKAIPAGPTAATYKSAVLNHHNYHRANHSAPNIQWSPKMASIARAIAQSCVYAHDVQKGGGGYGQNIAAGAPASDISGVITNMFYNNEVNHYPGPYGNNNPDMSNFEAWGHFSQVVWKDTTHVGCYTLDCSKKKGGLKNISDKYSNIAPVFTVCNYFPPGNYGGEYANVGKSINRVTVDGNFRVNEKNIKSPNPPPLSHYT